MNHLKQIAARLPEYGLDFMLLNSEPGEYYAVGFHGEGNVVVTAQGCFYFTDSRYIEAANHLITGAEIATIDYYWLTSDIAPAAEESSNA